jgi:hypothetical protein
VFLISISNGPILTSSSNSDIELEKIGVIETGGDAYDVWVDENLEIAYVTCGYGGLRIFDISDPRNPLLLSHVPESPSLIPTGHSSGFAHQLFVDQDIVYVGDGSSGLTIINSSDPKNPEVLVHFTGGYTWDINIFGDLAYIVNGWNNMGNPGFMILDISNPSSPSILSNSLTDGDTTDLELVGNKIYLVKATSGLKIIDVSDSSNPVLVGEFLSPSNSFAIDVEVNGDLAFLSYWKQGLKFLDVTDPTDIIELGDSMNGDELGFLSMHNGFLYLAAMSDGVIVYDVNDPEFPIVGSYTDTGKAYGILATDNYVYIADQVEGFKILTITDSSTEDPTSVIVNFGILAVVLMIHISLVKKQRKVDT